METLLIILICLAVAACGELMVVRNRQKPGRLPEDIQ